MSEKEYIIFCDESDKHGRYFSNFYGGVLVGASQYQRITQRLNQKKAELNLYAELKWAKVTERYLAKYQEMIECFFDEVRLGNLKVRIMFTQNASVPVGLTKGDLELQYYKLYYQFLKHAFGLKYVRGDRPIRVRFYLDELPDSGEKAESFKGYLLGMGDSADFRRAGIVLEKHNITEMHSHDHVLLQCLDVVLGSMSFRLNDKHKDKPQGAHRRAKRTIAKEKLYKAILAEIKTIHPNFNIGINTGLGGEFGQFWESPYRHWRFESANSVYDRSRTKRYIAKDPAQPTSIPDA